MESQLHLVQFAGLDIGVVRNTALWVVPSSVYFVVHAKLRTLRLVKPEHLP